MICRNGSRGDVMRTFWRLLAVWGSAILLGYLGLFWWVDAVLRLSTPFSYGALPLLTILLSLRAWLIRTRGSFGLSGWAFIGLLVDWHHILGFILLIAILAFWAWAQYRIRDPERTVLGRQCGWPITLTTRDRFLHLHVLGPTGSGKSSSVLMPLIRQDLMRGHGLLLLEPKGDLAHTAYRHAIDAHRNVIRFDPLLSDCPHFNPLAAEAERAAEGLAWTLNQLSEPGHPYYAVTARIQLLYAVKAVKAAVGPTADIGHLLTFLRNRSVQIAQVPKSEDDAVKSYFREQWSRPQKSQEERQGLVNRLELLWANGTVRRVLSSPHDFSWDQVLDEGWVVLCNLSLAELGQSARALGTLIWHGLAQATYRRNPQSSHRPFFAYLDEFHQWVSDDLSDFLALARGYSLGLILAHQDMGQLSPELQEAITANARQRLIMAGSAGEDIRRFMREAAPYSLARPLRYVPQGRAMAQLTRLGRLDRPRLIRLSYYPLSGDGHG